SRLRLRVGRKACCSNNEQRGEAASKSSKGGNVHVGKRRTKYYTLRQEDKSTREARGGNWMALFALVKWLDPASCTPIGCTSALKKKEYTDENNHSRPDRCRLCRRAHEPTPGRIEPFAK